MRRAHFPEMDIDLEEDDGENFYNSSSGGDDDDEAEEDFTRKKEERAAESLSMRLLAVNDDSDEEDRILRKSLRLMSASPIASDEEEHEALVSIDDTAFSSSSRRRRGSIVFGVDVETKPGKRIFTMVLMALVGFVISVAAAYVVGYKVVGPPNQPVGPYRLVERQEGDDFFQYYSFYEGQDSVGSNGYLQYVSRQHAEERKFLNVTYHDDEFDVFHQESGRLVQDTLSGAEKEATKTNKRPFIYIGSAPTEAGPRDSIRLEGNRRFNRGLFIIDVRHIPAGCGVWPAFWLTDEANWPVHGEIDIVEGVNYQDVAKTALHTTQGCSMADIPLGTMTGGWDTAQGIPNAKTGIPDMTLRYARNCFVYDQHQWLNQGCVAVDEQGASLGIPLNDKGGGVFALEWDPLNGHVRSYVFSPHTQVPDNLVDAIRTAHLPEEERIRPDPDQWPIPYGYFAVGEGTDCPASHFRQMRLVFNTAFCGSVAGNRFQLDCPKQAAEFDTCNEWIKSQPDEMDEAYWKIRGVFVYEREWQRTWLN